MELQAITGSILLVDDDEGVLVALSQALSRGGHAVQTAICGEAALELARLQPFDLAVVDRHMPGIDGIDVLHALRDLQPTCTRVLLTGGLDLATTLHAVNRGAIARVLQKPVELQTLQDMVDEALSHRRALAAAYADSRPPDGHQREELIRCLAGDDVQLALQPIVRAGDGNPIAYEALLRSSHPSFRTPLEILRAVEEGQLVGRLGEVVFARARRWIRRLPPEAKVFINLHPRELAQPEALAARLQTLADVADRAVLEITERASLDGVDGWERSIEVIEELGFAVAVDDLGSGYSSLSMLAELQPRYIKVDMSIIRDIDRVPRKRRLVDLLCRFAEATDSLVIAEGIETSAEAETVRECGAQLLQGFYFGRPSFAIASALDEQVPAE